MTTLKTGGIPLDGGALPVSPADDLLTGAEQIGAFFGWTPRQVYHAWETTDIPIFKTGNGEKCPLLARRSTLLAWIEEKERASSARRREEIQQKKVRSTQPPRPLGRRSRGGEGNA